MNGDLAALDYIENQITEAGMQQMQLKGSDFDMGELEMLNGEEMIM